MHLNTVTKYKYCYHLPLRAKHQISLFCPWARHLLWINESAKWLLASTLPVYTSQTMFLTIPERPLYEWHWYAEVSKTINAQATGSYCIRSRWHIRNGSVPTPPTAPGNRSHHMGLQVYRRPFEFHVTTTVSK